LAAMAGRLEVVKYLVSNGANVNAKNVRIFSEMNLEWSFLLH